MHKSAWFPTLFLLIGAAGLAGLAAGIKRSETERILSETTVMRDQVALRISSCVNSRAAAVNVLANLPWTGVQQIYDEWVVRAGSLHQLYNGILALNFVDADWRIAIIHPEAGNATALGYDLRAHPSPSIPASLAAAEARRTVVRSAVLELLQGGSGFALYQRITDPDGTTLGFVDGVFRIQELMQACLGEQGLRDRYRLQLGEAEGEYFWSMPANAAATPAEAGFSSTTDFDVLGGPWRLRIEPTPDWLQSQQDSFAGIWITLSAVLLGALALLLHSLMLKHEKLRNSEHRYRLLVENQHDLVVQVDAAGNFLYASPSFCRLFGRSDRELLGSNYQPLVHEDDRELVQRSLASLQLPPHVSYHEQRAATPSGWRLLAWSNSAVLDKQGNITAITALGRDITELRQLELRAAHAEKMQALGNLAGGISHDFNNILHVVLANIDFLKLEHAGDAALQRELDTISEPLERARALVARLSSLSRRDSTNKEIIDLNVYVDEVLTLLRRSLPPAIDLQLQPAAAPLQVLADKSQLEQVLLNLCFNARDAMAGKGRITVTLGSSAAPAVAGGTADEAGRSGAFICVQDSGTGISPEALPHIFEPFFTTKAAGSGTGLGLASCQSIIKQHQGRITVESTPGAGARFCIFLPLYHAGETPDPHTTVAGNAPLPDADADTRGPARGTILVVDDEAEIRRLTAELLRQAGYQVLFASDGEDALQRLQDARPLPALVLMDVLMPRLDGMETAQRILRDYPGLPVLLMSGHHNEEQAGDSLPVLHKPFSRDTLLRSVAQLLNQAGRAPAPR